MWKNTFTVAWFLEVLAMGQMQETCQMAHRVRRFVDEKMYFCMQQSNYGTARCLTTLEAIKNNSPALLQLQANLRNGVSRFVEPPSCLEQVNYHNIWETNLSAAYLDRFHILV